jgi:hypothetical protein
MYNFVPNFELATVEIFAESSCVKTAATLVKLSFAPVTTIQARLTFS